MVEEERVIRVDRCDPVRRKSAGPTPVLRQCDRVLVTRGGRRRLTHGMFGAQSLIDRWVDHTQVAFAGRERFLPGAHLEFAGQGAQVGPARPDVPRSDTYRDGRVIDQRCSLDSESHAVHQERPPARHAVVKVCERNCRLPQRFGDKTSVVEHRVQLRPGTPDVELEVLPIVTAHLAENDLITVLLVHERPVHRLSGESAGRTEHPACGHFARTVPQGSDGGHCNPDPRPCQRPYLSRSRVPRLSCVHT